MKSTRDLVLRDFSVALDNPKPICVGRSQAIDPGFVGHAECIDDERIAIPMPNGMSVRAPLKIVWMSHIHMDNSREPLTSIKNNEFIGGVQKLHCVVELQK